MIQAIQDLVKYRLLLRYLVTLELKQRYRGSVLGFLWTLLNPLLLMVVMWAVFSQVRKFDQEHYALFLFSGLMSWLFYAQSVEQSLNTIVSRAGLFKNLYLPKVIFPMSVVSSNLVNLVFFFGAYLLMSIATGKMLPVTVLLLPVAIFGLFLFALGTALITCSLNVFFRDITHLTSAILRALFYITPIFYRPEMLGEKAAFFLKLNPLYYPITCVRNVLYDGIVPSFTDWSLTFGIGTLLVVLGLSIFRNTESKFVYYT